MTVMSQPLCCPCILLLGGGEGCVCSRQPANSGCGCNLCFKPVPWEATHQGCEGGRGGLEGLQSHVRLMLFLIGCGDSTRTQSDVRHEGGWGQKKGLEG